ncbi:MAG TPA: hypothetical protein VGE90_14360 [Chitinophaga sp.]
MAKFTNQPHTASTKISNNTTSNLAGAGGGTLLLMLAKNIPDPSEIKSWLIILAPSVSVFLAWLWRLAGKKYDKFQKVREAKKLADLLYKDIDVALMDPSISEEEKEKLRRDKSAIKLEKIASMARKLKSIQSDI